MTHFFFKLKRYGFRRLFTFVLISGVSSSRIILYRFFFSDCSPKFKGSKIYLPTQYVGRGGITLFGCELGVWPSPYFINGYGYLEARSETAKITIGNGTLINNNFVIIADKTTITIGQNCLIGPNLFITDSDFHGIDIGDRNSTNYETASVVIGDDVFIGSDVKILKGVNIGYGAIIGSGSIVVSDVEQMSIYVGIPARKIGFVPNKHGIK